MLPDRLALIIGAMKCGTTSVFDHLGTHPEIARCRVKEPNIFCGDDFRPDDLDRYGSLWDWQPGRHRVAIEASVNYSKTPTVPDCAERMANCRGVDFRFIYCMRNPIDRIESHVYHGLYPGWTKPLDDGISDHTMNVSRYAMQLDAYSSRFGKDRIFLIVLEEFRKAPDRILRQVCEFLDVDPTFRFEQPAEAHNRASDHYLEHPLWARMRRLSPVRSLARLVPTRLRQELIRATGQKIEVRRKLTSGERSAIEQELRPDLIRLREEYGIDAAATWGIHLPAAGTP